MKKIKEFVIKNKIFSILLFILTIFRIYLAVKIPLFIQADALYDDFLFIKYADSLLHGNWLGDYGYTTLAKSPSFSIFIAFTSLLGIPYSLALILIYIFAIIIFIYAIKKIINNKYCLGVLYIFLLFSPVMFHIENVQKIYRGGLIVSFALLTVASTIGMYTRRREGIKSMLKWSILLSISLSFFYFIKEDSIWILPFVVTAIIVLVIDYIKNKKIQNIFKRIFISFLPIFILIISNITICSINYFKYGVYTVSDRTGSNFKKVIEDLTLIDDNKKYGLDVWISKTSMKKALKESETLYSIKDEIYDMYNSWGKNKDGEIVGDIIDWKLKEAVNNAGIYNKGGKYTEKFYGKIHKELQNAFKKGNLKKRKGIKISSMAPVGKKEDFKYLNKKIPESLISITTYNQNQIGIYKATGPIDDIALCDYLTNSIYVVDYSNLGYLNLYVNIGNKIVTLYQKTGLITLIVGIVGIVVLLIKSLIQFINKKYDNLSLFLITIGMILISFINLFGVEWFCRWCPCMRHIYNYTCGIIPLIQILEIIGFYYLIKTLKDIILKAKVL